MPHYDVVVEREIGKAREYENNNQYWVVGGVEEKEVFFVPSESHFN